MRFEYDKLKSKSNKGKHGIDFEEAQGIWESITVELPSRYREEPRRLVIGKLKGKFWTAIVTEREDALRIISVRRSRDEEEKLYEAITQNQ